MGTGDAAYEERLTPSAGWWLLGAALAASVGVVLLPVAGRGVGAVAAVVTAALVGGALWSTAARVSVTDGELAAGRAHIPVGLLGPPIPLDAERAALLRGREIDPAAYHLIRPWAPTAVIVDVLDPDDPTPYWYVATRSPDRLAAAIHAAQRAT